MADIVLSNCPIVTPWGVLEGGIAITGGKISAIASNAEDLPPAPKRIDAKSNHVIPGVIDAHCHVGWPVLTMVRGKIVMEDDRLTAEPGYGRFIPAEWRS